MPGAQKRPGQPLPPGSLLMARAWEQALSETDPADVELLGLGVVVAVFKRMNGGERRRTLRYIRDRFGSTWPTQLDGIEVHLQ